MSTSPHTDTEPSPCPALLLAAGASRRYGGPKLAAPWRGTSLLQHSASTLLAGGADPLYVVLGAHATLYREHLAALPVTCLVFADWAEGMGSSLAFATRHISTQLPSAAKGLLVSLADQAHVTHDHIRALFVTHLQHPSAIVASSYAETYGVPCIWPRHLWPMLGSLQGERGGRDLLKTHASAVIPISCPAALHDLDYRQDFDEPS